MWQLLLTTQSLARFSLFRPWMQTYVFFKPGLSLPSLNLWKLITSDKNRVLFDELAVFPQLQYKLSLLVRSMRRALVMDKFLAHNTMSSFLFCLDRNISQIFKKQQLHILHNHTQLSPSYVTRERDRITLPNIATF